MRTIPAFLSLLIATGCTTKYPEDSGLESTATDADDGSSDGTNADGVGDDDGGDGDGSDDDGGDDDGGDDDGGDDDGGDDDGGDGDGSDDDDGGDDDGTGDMGDDDADADDGSGTGGGTGGSTGGGIAIAGSYWNESASISYTISDSAFSEVNGPPVAATYVWDLSSYDNDEQYAIGETPSEMTWLGEGWTRFDWGTGGGRVYVCMTVTDAEDEAAALATSPADASGGWTEGCPALGGWLMLTPF